MPVRLVREKDVLPREVDDCRRDVAGLLLPKKAGAFGDEEVGEAERFGRQHFGELLLEGQEIVGAEPVLVDFQLVREEDAIGQLQPDEVQRQQKVEVPVEIGEEATLALDDLLKRRHQVHIFLAQVLELCRDVLS